RILSVTFTNKASKLVFAFPLPAVPEIGVVADDDHESAVIVKDPAVVNFLGVVAFVGESSLSVPDGGDLRLFFQVIDDVEDGVLDREVDGFAVWEDLLDVLIKKFPFLLTPEVVKHGEPTVEQVSAHCGG